MDELTDLKGTHSRVPLDLSGLVREVADQLEQSEHDRAVSLRIEQGLSVDADSPLVQIVLENLLRNAWKFTSKRTDAEIEFGSLHAGDEVSYYVRDNGAGFSMAHSKKLFGVFQRLHPESEFASTGVGLATVKRTIGRHGGRVWAVGESGRGATFYFTLNPPHERRRFVAQAAAG